MSDPNLKGVKRTSARQTSSASSAKNRSTTGKSPRPSPLVKRSTTEKAPARKAAKAAHASVKTKAAKQSAKASITKALTAAARKPVASKSGNKQTIASTSKSTKKPAVGSASKKRIAETKTKQIVAAPAVAAPRRPSTSPPTVVHRQPTRDEAAALRAFERAHKEFARGRFSEARALFRALIEQHAGVSEVTARARTYLAIAETRLRTEPILPRDADSLYDRGVIELNRGEFVAAQELFERALKREPEAAHVHYGMAATRARLGSISSAIESLRRALELQPRLRVRAQHDQDLAALRNDPEFDTLIFAPRS